MPHLAHYPIYLGRHLSIAMHYGSSGGFSLSFIDIEDSNGTLCILCVKQSEKMDAGFLVEDQFFQITLSYKSYSFAPHEGIND